MAMFNSKLFVYQRVPFGYFSYGSYDPFDDFPMKMSHLVWGFSRGVAGKTKGCCFDRGPG